MSLADATSFRRTAGGVCLLLGPLLVLLASILDPTDTDGAGSDLEYVVELGSNAEMAQLSTALWIVGFAVLAVGIVGLVHVIRERGVVLAHLGGGLAIVGLILFAAYVATTIGDLVAVEKLGTENADKLVDGFEDYWVARLVLIAGFLGTFFGFVLLGAALIRSDRFHDAAGALIIGGILLAAVQSKLMGIAGDLLLLAGFGMTGLKLLGMSDAEWERRVPSVDAPRQH